MPLDPDACYRALVAHDARFDGRFFVGVRSTGIYCRPVCTVRTPRRAQCRFFPSAAAAEADGFRPCLRCRPELAPGFAAVDASRRLAHAAIALMDDGFLEGRTLDALAQRLGITSRHLRRIFENEFGVAPVAYAQTQRLLLAKRLLTDTALPVTDVAFASGFASVRRMHALFAQRYRMPPTRLRMRGAPARAATLTFALGFRPPYAWDTVLAFLGARAMAGVERRDGGAFVRALAIRHRGDRHAGVVRVTLAPRKAALVAEVSPSLVRVLPQVLARVRHVFDLGCDPQEVARVLGPLAAARPGLRIPGAFEGFEIGVRGIVGQQVSVRAMTTLMGRFATTFGLPLDAAPDGITHAFPEAADVATRSEAEIAAIGLPKARARSILALARAVAEGLDLSPSADAPATVERLLALPGIGPWTAQYIALRGLGWPDAFPHSDLGVRRALGLERPADVLAHAERWRPWRGYAVLHLWHGGGAPAPRPHDPHQEDGDKEQAT
ncbi:MAG TPA: AlkA N-terminal domain-containing protein [Casimicrobiaceae bacterium]|nr:AlkA N-terminal domain-containing protein [Casimicrobiaceae bacterium]